MAHYKTEIVFKHQSIDQSKLEIHFKGKIICCLSFGGCFKRHNNNHYACYKCITLVNNACYKYAPHKFPCVIVRVLIIQGFNKKCIVKF